MFAGGGVLPLATAALPPELMAALGPLIREAATGAALGGGSRQTVAAAVAASIRTGTAALLGVPARAEELELDLRLSAMRPAMQAAMLNWMPL